MLALGPQVIGDDSRGWAWTRVLLGVQASELHCCGDPSVVPLLQRICGLTGDSLEVRSVMSNIGHQRSSTAIPRSQIRTYSRLSPLEVSASPVASLRDVRKGDCVVCFSRARLFEAKASVEALTGLTTAVVYGGLPPAVRKAQARLFNGDRTENRESRDAADKQRRADVLIATDAVGMGLNLRIRRIIFSQVWGHPM